MTRRTQDIHVEEGNQRVPDLAFASSRHKTISQGWINQATERLTYSDTVAEHQSVPPPTRAKEQTHINDIPNFSERLERDNLFEIIEHGIARLRMWEVRHWGRAGPGDDGR